MAKKGISMAAVSKAAKKRKARLPDPPSPYGKNTAQSHRDGEVALLDENTRLTVSSIQRDVAALQTELATEKRKRQEYFDLIESVLKQRDTWKEMFQVQSAEHAAAQGQLLERVQSYGLALVTAVRVLNDDRVRHGEEPLQLKITKTDGREIVRSYHEIVDDLKKAAPVDFDPIAERDRIQAAAEVPSRIAAPAASAA